MSKCAHELISVKKNVNVQAQNFIWAHMRQSRISQLHYAIVDLQESFVTKNVTVIYS